VTTRAAIIASVRRERGNCGTFITIILANTQGAVVSRVRASEV